MRCGCGGRRPNVGDDIERFGGFFKVFTPEGQPLSRNQSPMATTLRDGTPCRNREVIFERPDGTRISVLVNVDPVRDESGEVVGAINAFHEITPLRYAEQAAAHLASIIDSSDDAIVSKDLSGIIQSWNKGAERIFGYTAEEAVGQPITLIIPHDRREEEVEILRRLNRGERIEHFETIRVRKDGTPLDISVSISPVKDSQGRIIGASKIARDITERKRMERMLAELQQRYAVSLEEKVKRTSAELTQSQERLRMAERMASLGTLSAGLGHDMGNVLMPLRAHVDALAATVTASGNGWEDHLESIRKSMDYLHSLAGGLRMLAIEPTRQQHGSSQTNMESWWRHAQPILKTALGRHFMLEHEIPASLPAAAIPAHMLTQAVFNLVQNAAHAMSGPPPQEHGRVRITARQHGESLRISIQDNGPGMTEEVRQRCIEPYFTTKSRGISTGLGLTLVHGIAQSVGGSLEIESELGRGATFTLEVPVAVETAPRVTAAIQVGDQRLAALAMFLLQSQNFVLNNDNATPELLVTDDFAAADAYLKSGSGRAVIFSDSMMNSAAADRCTVLPTNAKTAEIRAAFHATTGAP